MRAIGATFDRFFSERGTHLAAMVAYFALASFVPLIFLALSVLGFLDQADSSSALVSYLEDVFPGHSVESIVSVVDAVQRNATTLSIVGAVALLWSSISLFSALESAFNIVYGRPNRPFLRGKLLAVAYMIAALLVLFAGLSVGTLGYDLMRRYATDVVSNQRPRIGDTPSNGSTSAVTCNPSTRSGSPAPTRFTAPPVNAPIALKDLVPVTTLL